MSRGQAWSKKEVLDLWNAVGSYSLAWIQRHTEQPFLFPNAPKHRSAQAVYKKVRLELGHGGLTRGAWTINRMEKYTGYSRSQLIRAQQALRQRWQRLGPRGWFLVTQEQLEELIGWLVHDYWSQKHRLYGCVWCTTETTALKGSGLCQRCFWKHRRLCLRLGLPTKLSEQFKVVSGMLSPNQNEGRRGTFLERAASRIAAGVALEPADLRMLARAREEVGAD